LLASTYFSSSNIDSLIVPSLSNAPVEEQMGGWNVDKKQYTKAEYVAVKTKYFIMSHDSGFCLVNVQALVVYFANASSQFF
jgi:hypothetical protein